jgi:hypothetical protein
MTTTSTATAKCMTDRKGQFIRVNADGSMVNMSLYGDRIFMPLAENRDSVFTARVAARLMSLTDEELRARTAQWDVDRKKGRK